MRMRTKKNGKGRALASVFQAAMLWIALLHLLPAHGQVNLAGGLSNTFVLSMALDGDGNVWAGTEAGLNRIAGRTISIFDRGLLGSNNDKIVALYYDAEKNRMIIGTEQGMLIYDIRRNVFGCHLKGDPIEGHGLVGVADDHHKGVWLAFDNGKVQHLDCTTDMVTTLTTDLHHSRCIMDDGQGCLFLGLGGQGMTIVSSKTGKTLYRLTHREGDATSLPGNNVRCIRQDSHKRIWIGTDRGVALYHDNTFSLVRHAVDTPLLENVFDIMEMPDGLVWVACDVGGISVVNPDQLLFDESRHISTSSANSRCILLDTYDNIWVGNHSTGIDFMASRPPLLHPLFSDPIQPIPVRPQPTYAVTNDSEGRVWVSSGDELSLWTASPGDRTPLQQSEQWKVTGMRHRAHSFARSMMVDSHGYVWMGMEDEGVIRFDTRTHRFEVIDIGYDVCDIHSFFEDRDGRVWIGAERGVCVYEQGHVEHVDAIDRLTDRAPVTSFMRLPDGRMLLATQGRGLIVVNTTTMAAQTIRMEEGLPTNNINQAISDQRQGIWLATFEGLVYLPDISHVGQMEVYGRKEGLSDYQIRAVGQDGQGRIWVSTYGAIAVLNKEARRFHVYNQQNNSSVGGFMAGAFAKATNGAIVFGSPCGACYLYPEETASSQSLAHVRIVLVETFASAGSSEERPSLWGDDVRTDYWHNTLRIAYTVDNYAQVDDVEYSYMMKGLSNKWFYNNSDDDVMFRNLPPGNYTFLLRAKLKSQDWDEAVVTKMRIRVTPPFWRSWWAYTFYALILAALAYFLFSQYRRRLALRHSLEMTRVENMQKQELNEERLRFFTNITHELRTPLTLILGPIEDLVNTHDLPAAAHRKLENISKSAQRLRDLINQILEFRKTETQNRRLSVARGDIGRFVEEIVLNFKELNHNKNVQVMHSVSPNLPPVYFDSEVITTIMANLLSNAAKYTELGSINVSVAADGHDGIAISVSDTGCGMADDVLPHIFDRYYQVKGEHQASGTGIGLALVKALADLHEAQLSVESRKGIGSRFTLTLGIGNTYPEALHKEDTSAAPRAAVPVAPDGGEQADGEQDQLLLLIVEDNADILQYIADSLSDDFRIAKAMNGADGLAIAQAEMPDLIVSDIMMPKMDGIEMTTQLKNDIRTCHIPIILLTAKDTDQDKEEGYDSGADSYLTKPFTAKLLASRIRNLLTNRRRLASMLNPTGDHLSSRDHLSSHDTGDGDTGSDTEPPQMNPLDKEFIDKMNRVIEENIMTEDIDMAFLTDKMAMSHSTFYRKVKALTGMTAKEYVRKRRMLHCYQLLVSGNYNVTEAAMMTGFNQMAHFREVFKKEFGVLPSEVVKRRS